MATKKDKETKIIEEARNEEPAKDPKTEELVRLARKAKAFDMLAERMALTLTESVYAKAVMRTMRGGKTAYLTEAEYAFMKSVLGK